MSTAVNGNNVVVLPPCGTATNGQVLTWNGVQWIPTNINITNTAGGGIIGGYGQIIIGGGGGGVGAIQLDLPGIPDTIPEKKTDGATCKKCEEFNEFAQSNQEDNTFLCYRCRHNL